MLQLQRKTPRGCLGVLGIGEDPRACVAQDYLLGRVCAVNGELTGEIYHMKSISVNTLRLHAHFPIAKPGFLDRLLSTFPPSRLWISPCLDRVGNGR